MTGNVNGLSAAHIKVIAQKTGISEERIKEMTDEQVAELLKGNHLTAVDESQLPKGPTAEEPGTKKSNKFLSALKTAAGASVLGLISVVTKGKGQKVLALAGAAAAALLLTSCSEFDDEEKINIRGNVYNSINIQGTDEFKALLEEIRAMREENKENIKILLDALLNMGADLKTIIEALTNNNVQNDIIIQMLEAQAGKLDTMIEGQNNILEAIKALGNENITIQKLILDVVCKILDNTGKINANTEKIIKNQNKQIGIMLKILDAIKKGNADINEIKDFLKNLNLASAQVDLTAIEALLQKILEQAKANGQAINNQTEIVKAMLDSIKKKIDNTMRQNHADLVAILEKIPNPVECGCDCNRIIELLYEIIEGLKTPGASDDNHEGIRQDYGDLLG